MKPTYRAHQCARSSAAVLQQHFIQNRQDILHVTDAQIAGVLHLVRSSHKAAFEVYADLAFAKRTRPCSPTFLSLHHTVKEIVDEILSQHGDQ